MVLNDAKLSVAITAMIVFTNSAMANPACYMQSSTASQVKGSIDRVADVVEYPVQFTHNQRKCVVTFRGLANGKWWNGQGEFVYNDTMPDQQGCSIALKIGQSNLLAHVFGKQVIGNEQMICSDFPQPELKPGVKVGDTVQISQLNPHPSKRDDFVYKGAICRFFVESTMNDPLTKFYTYQGVACTTDRQKNFWKIVDMW